MGRNRQHIIALVLAAAVLLAPSAGAAEGTYQASWTSLSPSGALELASDPQGVRVIRASGDAARTGLVPGDRVGAIDGIRVQTPDGLMTIVRAVLRCGGDRTHRLQILRGGQIVTTKVADSAWQPYLRPTPPAPPPAPSAPTLAHPAPPVPPATPPSRTY